MQYKYLFGSKLLRLKNCRDEDWVTFSELRPRKAMEIKCRSIPAQTFLINDFIKGDVRHPDVFKANYIFEMSVGFHDEDDYPFKSFNILEHRDAWIKNLKALINSEEFEREMTLGETLRKPCYKMLYQYYMISENEHFISDKARVNVQKIHDYEMPSSFFYELRELINSL